MCRFLAYLGQPIILHDILYKPAHSLIKQSFHATEMDETLNGDGFGISWYVPQIDNLPGVFKSIQPAWNNLNLEKLSEKIMSTCFMAHVRAASQGDVNFFNTHPFDFKNFSFMHNGIIGGFDKIRRTILCELSDNMFDWLKGQTDSELFFALFLDLFQKSKKEFNVKNCVAIFKEAVDYIKALQKKFNIKDVSLLNCVISDGESLFAFRYVSNQEKKANTLYYSFGHHIEYQDGYCHMQPSKGNQNQAILITSEKLTSNQERWQEVPTNHMLFVNKDLEIEAHKL